MNWDPNKPLSEEHLKMIESMPVADVRMLPLHPWLKGLLTSTNYLNIMKKVDHYSKHPESGLMAAEVPYSLSFPPHTRDAVHAVLDINWEKRANTAVALLKQSIAEFEQRYLTGRIFLSRELYYAADFFMRRTLSNNPISKKEFSDMSKAFQTLSKEISHEQYDLSTPAKLASVLLDELSKILKLDFEKIWSDLKDDRVNLLNEHQARAKILQNIIINLVNLVPEGKVELHTSFQNYKSIELELLLDLSLICVWKRVRKETEEKVQSDALQCVFDDYATCAGYYGMAPVKCECPMKLIKARLFRKKLAGSPLAVHLPRLLSQDYRVNRDPFAAAIRQCNATVAPIFLNSITNPNGKLATDLFTSLLELTKDNIMEAVNELPEFFYQHDEMCMSELLKEGSVKLKELSFFYDEKNGKFKVCRELSSLSTAQTTFIGNLLIIEHQGSDLKLPMTQMVEDFETGKQITFSLAAFTTSKDAYVKRANESWYLVKPNNVTMVDKNEIMDSRYSVSLAYYYIAE